MSSILKVDQIQNTDGQSALVIASDGSVDSVKYEEASNPSGRTITSTTMSSYEEGTWVPTVYTTDFVTSGLSIDSASYVKVGNIVTLAFSGQFTGTSGNWTIGDYAELGGIPFAPQSTACAPANSSGNFSASTSTTLMAMATGTGIYLSPDNVFGSTARSQTVKFSITYEAA